MSDLRIPPTETECMQRTAAQSVCLLNKFSTDAIGLCVLNWFILHLNAIRSSISRTSFRYFDFPTSYFLCVSSNEMSLNRRVSFPSPVLLFSLQPCELQFIFSAQLK
jgi:hypothetical protein